MKAIRSLMIDLMICGIASAIVETTAAQSVMQGTAKVIHIRGAAWYSPAGGDYQPLYLGTTLTAGSVIQTENASGAYVDIALFPSERGNQSEVAQSVVRIAESSQLGIDKLTWSLIPADLSEPEVAYDIQLHLAEGKILGVVGGLSAASSFQVKLPNGLADVGDGTVFMMTYVISRMGFIDVLDGEVVVAYQTPQGVVTQVVSAGQSFNTNLGQIDSIVSEEAATLIIKSMLTFVAKNASRLDLYPGMISDDNPYSIEPTTGP